MKKGMNPEAVEAVASSVEALAEEIRGVYEARMTQVTDLDWTGQDRDQYLSEFDSEVGGANQSVISQLDAFVERLRSNVRQQRETSSS